jgi:hypothetical protein
VVALSPLAAGAPVLAGLDAVCPIGLDALQAAADLQDRFDRKYVVPVATVEALLERLAPTHAVLELDGLRAFRYRSAYFDTPDLRAFRDHVQQRRRRFKCRTRMYVDAALCAFEVKLKGPRGRTVKHRMPCDRPELTPPALAFLRARLLEAYGRPPEPGLAEALVVEYTRITLADVARGERLTCDLGLRFRAPDGAVAVLAPGTAVVESKSSGGSAPADRALRALGARPEGRCSKYCVGIAATRPQVKANALRPLLRRHVISPCR